MPVSYLSEKCCEHIHRFQDRTCDSLRQSRKFHGLDTLEALANAVIGLLVSWAATFFVLGYSPAGSAAVTAMFFVLSFTRSWVLRRVFRRAAR